MKHRNPLVGTMLGLLIFGAAAAHAQEIARPVMLVASPELQAGYSQTVLVAVPVGDAQHIGFILNRATGATLATLFPEHAPSRKVVDPVYFGGPMMADNIFAVVRSARNPGRASLPLFGDLVLAVSAESVDRIIEQSPNDARYFAGLVGWRPGELAAEIRGGLWHVIEPDADLVFRKDTGGMWKELSERLGIDATVPSLRRRGSLIRTSVEAR
jgi:putative AlgH/UPF0301 family transcriptional regulator